MVCSSIGYATPISRFLLKVQSVPSCLHYTHRCECIAFSCHHALCVMHISLFLSLSLNFFPLSPSPLTLLFLHLVFFSHSSSLSTRVSESISHSICMNSYDRKFRFNNAERGIGSRTNASTWRIFNKMSTMSQQSIELTFNS